MPLAALILLALVSASSGVFLPAQFPPTVEDIQRVCLGGGKNGLALIPPFQFRPLWCFLFETVRHSTAAPSASTTSPSGPTTLPYSLTPHICVADAKEVTCDLKHNELCPRAFNLDLMRVEEAVECTLGPRSNNDMNKSHPRNNNGNTSLPQLYRLTFAGSNDIGECRGPFMCEYSPITRKHICPGRVSSSNSLCIPIPQF